MSETDLREKAQALVAKWRKTASRISPFSAGCVYEQAIAIQDCASELEAVLSSPPRKECSRGPARDDHPWPERFHPDSDVGPDDDRCEECNRFHVGVASPATPTEITDDDIRCYECAEDNHGKCMGSPCRCRCDQDPRAQGIACVESTTGQGKACQGPAAPTEPSDEQITATLAPYVWAWDAGEHLTSQATREAACVALRSLFASQHEVKP